MGWEEGGRGLYSFYEVVPLCRKDCRIHPDGEGEHGFLLAVTLPSEEEDLHFGARHTSACLSTDDLM